MTLLRWIGGIVVLFWVLGLIFRIGGGLIHLLLIVAAVVFIFDAITGRGKDNGDGRRDRT
ncbi:lmo0937 family membrane protein [Clostridium bovifaecis]|uniref:Lmo0937 family membrane protein n=1 Tax=Clostridium bovifaecis TaxID=2184719 RepID=A0A6I6EV04_9CLOT|nr:lmo0937 family membrane protein [Clostridium bovifaecis]